MMDFNSNKYKQFQEMFAGMSPEMKEQMMKMAKAQMKSLRAYCYFTLVRCFRDVPVTPHAYLESSDNLMAPQMAPGEFVTDIKRRMAE